MASERFGFSRALPLCARLGLRPVSFGRQRHAWPKGVPERRVFPFYEIAFLTEGRHFHESDLSRERTVEAGSVLLHFPGIWHRYGPPDARPARHYYLLFEGALADRWRAQGLLDPARPVVALRNPAAFRRRLARLWREMKSDPDGRALAVVRGLMDLMTLLSTQVQERDEGDGRMLLAKEAMFEARFQLRFQFRAWCEARGLGYEQFRKQFKRETGLSPEAWFDQMKVADVKERLARGKESILSLANASGFDDPYYFSRWFKKLERIPPSAYRALFHAERGGGRG